MVQEWRCSVMGDAMDKISDRMNVSIYSCIQTDKYTCMLKHLTLLNLHLFKYFYGYIDEKTQS